MLVLVAQNFSPGKDSTCSTETNKRTGRGSNVVRISFNLEKFSTISIETLGILTLIVGSFEMKQDAFVTGFANWPMPGRQRVTILEIFILTKDKHISTRSSLATVFVLWTTTTCLHET
jgi:hypothetical protein